MKLLLPLCFLVSAAWGIDYDPKFHLKHRYNKHETILKVPESQKAQRMEMSETSKKPLETTPNMRTPRKNE